MLACMSFYVLIMVSDFTFIRCENEAKKSDLFKPGKVHHRIFEKRIIHKGDDGKRGRRWISYSDANKITDTVNSLRSSVGASNMNYLTYSSSQAADCTNWTNHCDYDADIYGTTPGYALVAISTNRSVDHVSALKEYFNDSGTYYGLRSVYLQNVGAGETFCLTIKFEGELYRNIALAAYSFGYTSAFDQTQRQYALGAQCTTCLSGSYWCYKGLCKADCSDIDSNCQCNYYCRNCGYMDTTCRHCQCLQGWTGSHCETASGINAVTMSICPTTTTSTTTTTPQPRSGNNQQRSSHSGSLIGMSMIHLAIYGAVALFLRA